MIRGIPFIYMIDERIYISAPLRAPQRNLSGSDTDRILNTTLIDLLTQNRSTERRKRGPKVTAGERLSLDDAAGTSSTAGPSNTSASATNSRRRTGRGRKRRHVSDSEDSESEVVCDICGQWNAPGGMDGEDDEWVACDCDIWFHKTCCIDDIPQCPICS